MPVHGFETRTTRERVTQKHRSRAHARLLLFLIDATAFDGANLFANCNQRIAETIEFRLGFALCGLNHQGAGNWPRHRGRVESVIHHALGDVIDLQSRGFVEGTEIKNELVRAQAMLVAVEHAVVRLEFRGHVVGVENRNLGGATHSVGTHHRDVHPRDDQNRRAAVRRGRDRTDRVDNVLKNAPHTVAAVTSDVWTHQYTRAQAAYPAPWLSDFKFWPAVGRVDNPYGDRNLVCACEPVTSYQ